MTSPAVVYVVLTDASYEPSSVEAVTTDLDLAKMIAEAHGLTYVRPQTRATASDWRDDDDGGYYFTTGFGDGGMRIERHEVAR